MRQRLAQRAKSSDRIDDDHDTIMKRLKTFEKTNQLVIEHLQKSSPVWLVSNSEKLVERIAKISKIDCERSIPEVYASMQDAMRKVLYESGDLKKDEIL